MKKRNLILILSLLASTTVALSQTKVIAHRGFWKTDGSAQNSIAALFKADSIGVYGSEMDVWLALDDVPMVNHDAYVTLNGERLIIENTPSEVLRQVKLANGEPLPTLEEYLDAFEKCRNVKLILEFKSHKSKAREDVLSEKTIKWIHERGLQEKVEYIAFGINFINQVRRIDPAAPVYYLNGDLTPGVLFKMGAAGLDYHHSVFQKHPHWVKEAHDLGLKVNTWTVNAEEDINKMLGLNVDFITTDEPLLTKNILNHKK